MLDKKLNILIVDDVPKNIQVLGSILSKEGYILIVAENGLQALSAVKHTPPDLILLDIMMPELDGIETCKRLKADSETKDIPIIFLTAKIDTEDIVRGFEVGAVDYVAKPFNSVELLARVNTHLQLRIAQKEAEFKNEQLNVLNNKLSKYLAPQVYQSIFSGEKEVKIEATSKQLTIFFSDIVDFTPMSEKMEDQKLARWLNHYLNEMAKITFRYEGTLDKYIGDSVMVFFGDPKTLGVPEDAIQCVTMAIEMLKKAKELGVEIRIGINTGECTAGNFGSDDRMEYTVIGKSVNLASRLEEKGEPGKIHISEATYQAIKHKIHCEPHGKIRVKGIDRDIMTYWVLME